jgi:uncharacterized protein YdcH (DUF465 family)
MWFFPYSLGLFLGIQIGKHENANYKNLLNKYNKLNDDYKDLLNKYNKLNNHDYKTIK